jgi:hypothetical protein
MKLLKGLILAVKRVHEFHMVHNDIKLDNVLVGHEGGTKAVLCDFEMFEKTGGPRSITHSRSVLSGGAQGGTLAYMAPERLRDQRGTLAVSPGTVDSDMYSVGVVILLCCVPDLIPEVEARTKTSPPIIRQVIPKCDRRVPGWEQPDTSGQIPQSTDIAELLFTQHSDHVVCAAPRRPRGLLASQYPRRSTADVLECPSFCKADAGVPVYWEQMTAAYAPRTTQHMPHVPLSPQPTVAADEGFKCVPVDGATLARLRKVLIPLCPDQLGVGRDCTTGWEHIPDPSKRTVEIARAWRLENAALWKRYIGGVEMIQTDCLAGPPIDSDTLPAWSREKVERRGLDLHGTVRPTSRLWRASRDGFRPDKRDFCRSDVHEAFLLHGTAKKNVVKLLASGLNERYSGSTAGSLFGQGTYLAEDIEKADQYTYAVDKQVGVGSDGQPSTELEGLHKELYPNGEADHPGDVCYALVCRVAMGYSIRTQGRRSLLPNDRQLTAMDGKAASANKCVFPEGPGRPANGRVLVELPLPQGQRSFSYHSLIAETGGLVDRFREFVTFDAQNYVYPEYIVAYKRVPKTDCAKEGAVDIKITGPDLKKRGKRRVTLNLWRECNGSNAISCWSDKDGGVGMRADLSAGGNVVRTGTAVKLHPIQGSRFQTIWQITTASEDEAVEWEQAIRSCMDATMEPEPEPELERPRDISPRGPLEPAAEPEPELEPS